MAEEVGQNGPVRGLKTNLHPYLREIFACHQCQLAVHGGGSSELVKTRITNWSSGPTEVPRSSGGVFRKISDSDDKFFPLESGVETNHP